MKITGLKARERAIWSRKIISLIGEYTTGKARGTKDDKYNGESEGTKDDNSCHLDCAVHGSREDPTSGDSETRHAALVTHQGLGADHVVHTPNLHQIKSALFTGFANKKNSKNLSLLWKWLGGSRSHSDFF